ncbi:uncharacterized protein LOC132831362 isoform X2 [Hemiscyllium ocellatum]|uniref:uncharacterized protein LOC132831362 isoform X2 n=1 Tax=Hemiscyllium ocellatum TaxID=170820 RepID=UPI0029665FBC|nr:uncharacterized protein LOC132831362 isoform X2 [Hemiscyllium ocellatum]
MPLSVRILVCLLLYTQQGQGDLRCQIKQEELMIVAVLNERVKITYAVHMEKSLTLQYILGTICIILTLYSVAATSVVLVKRKMCARCKTHLVRAADLNPVPQAQKPRNSESQQNARTESAGTATTEDAYMALQKHEVSVYSSLDNDRSKTQASSWRYKASTGAQNIQPQAEEETYESVYESY